jgi:hypothetical protein
MASEAERPLEALLDESRRFEPTAEFRAAANASDPGIYERAAADPEGYWAEWARELDWFEPWERVLEWSPPRAKWFEGGKLNVSYNCLDRHLSGARRNKAALVWEGEPGDTRTYTYWDLHREVSRFANVLKELGVARGDRVAIYLPMIPEAAIAMLSCARIGAIHSVVFGGFSADSLRDRITDAGAKVLITADGGYRRGSVIPLKDTADRALKETPGVEHVVVVRRRLIAQDSQVHMKAGRDHWYHELMQEAPADCPAEPMDAEDVLYILYTSGTTGKPKGVVHTTGGYLTHVYATTRLVFDLKEDDMYWCTADVGWVTGHSYIVYGPLANGATVFMYEGAPDWPDRGRFWKLVQKYGVTVFYTAPTAIRAFMRWGTDWPGLRPVDAPASGDGGGAHQSGSVDVVPGAHRRRPLSDRRHVVADGDGWDHDHAAAGDHGDQAGQRDDPVPRGHRGPAERGRALGAGRLPDDHAALAGHAAHGLGGRGRYPSDVLVEVARDLFPRRRREARRGRLLLDPGPRGRRAERGRPPHRDHGGRERAGGPPVGGGGGGGGACRRGEGAGDRGVRDVKDGVQITELLKEELREHVADKIGPIARPDAIIFAAELPKTRSGKIMRRLLKDIAEGRAVGDTTTLADPAVVDRLKSQYGED